MRLSKVYKVFEWLSIITTYKYIPPIIIKNKINKTAHTYLKMIFAIYFS